MCTVPCRGSQWGSTGAPSDRLGLTGGGPLPSPGAHGRSPTCVHHHPGARQGLKGGPSTGAPGGPLGLHGRGALQLLGAQQVSKGWSPPVRPVPHRGLRGGGVNQCTSGPAGAHRGIPLAVPGDLARACSGGPLVRPVTQQSSQGGFISTHGTLPVLTEGCTPARLRWFTSMFLLPHREHGGA